MNKQAYYEEQSLENALQQFMGAPSLAPADYEDAYALRNAPRTDMTMPAGVWATQLDVSAGPTSDGLMGRPGREKFVEVDWWWYLGAATVLYLLFRPEAQY